MIHIIMLSLEEEEDEQEEQDEKRSSDLNIYGKLSHILNKLSM